MWHSLIRRDLDWHVRLAILFIGFFLISSISSLFFVSWMVKGFELREVSSKGYLIADRVGDAAKGLILGGGPDANLNDVLDRVASSGDVSRLLVLNTSGMVLAPSSKYGEIVSDRRTFEEALNHAPFVAKERGGYEFYVPIKDGERRVGLIYLFIDSRRRVGAFESFVLVSHVFVLVTLLFVLVVRISRRDISYVLENGSVKRFGYLAGRLARYRRRLMEELGSCLRSVVISLIHLAGVPILIFDGNWKVADFNDAVALRVGACDSIEEGRHILDLLGERVGRRNLLQFLEMVESNGEWKGYGLVGRRIDAGVLPDFRYLVVLDEVRHEGD